MRTLAGLVLLVSLALPGLAPAQEGPAGILFTRNRQFRVPFNLGAGAQTLDSLQLYVSTDFGKSWTQVASAPPNQGYFRFATERDGQFWFAVQTTDKNNRPYPATMDGATPNLKVIVDNVPPAVQLTRLPPRGSEVGVAWNIQDETFSPSQADAIRLEYRPLHGAAAWTPLSVPSNASQFYWDPRLSSPIEVRLSARDQAGNVGDGTTTVGIAGSEVPTATNTTPSWGTPNPNVRFAIDPSQNPADRFAGIANPPSINELKLVGSKRISLDYAVKDVGPSAVSAIELWYTYDGKTWTRYTEPFQDDPRKKLVFEMEREGLYGLTLLAKSGVGLGERPPQPGDRPQIWVEVDLTKPQVAVRDTLVGQGLSKGKLKIQWSASDRNLAPTGIALKYAADPAGPWTTIADKLTNSGEYTWTMPPQLPYQFHVKVEAVDRAGNVGEDVTAQPVKVDLSIPRAIPIDISPAPAGN